MMTMMISDEQLDARAAVATTNLESWLDTKDGPKTYAPHVLPEYAGSDWAQHGLCHDAPGDWVDLNQYRATNRQTIKQRKRYELEMCRLCPVQIPCLDFALTTNQTEGIWGGTTPQDRDESTPS